MNTEGRVVRMRVEQEGGRAGTVRAHQNRPRIGRRGRFSDLVLIPYRLFFPLLALLLPTSALAQEKKDDKGKDVPTVLLANPLVLPRGTAVTVKLRGVKLAETTEVRIFDAENAPVVAIKSKGKADLPNKVDAKEAGDSHVEIELTAPVEVSADTLSIVVVTPAGETKPYSLRVAAPARLTPEKESNGGFRQAQPITPTADGITIQGAVQESNDVDVFRIDGKAGRRLVAEVFAARHGSVLDPILTLYDARGHLVAAADDTPAGRDAALDVKFPSDGPYYLALNDAHDRGGAAHPYALSVKVAE